VLNLRHLRCNVTEAVEDVALGGTRGGSTMSRSGWLTFAILITFAAACSRGEGPAAPAADTCDDEVAPLPAGAIAQRQLVGGIAGDDDRWVVFADGRIEHDHLSGGESETLLHHGGTAAASNLSSEIAATMLDREIEGCYLDSAGDPRPDGQYHGLRVRIHGVPRFYATDGSGAPDQLFEVLGLIDAFINEAAHPAF
jgi:hypothetical protein